MAKRVAVVAVDPVNGAGLFAYLEAFYENGIPFELFAVAREREIATNSGVRLRAEGTIAELKADADRFDALVFACGDAVPRFAEHANEPYNRDLMEVIADFGAKGKIMIGHCAAAMLFDMAGIVDGKKVAVHPLAKAAVQRAVATDAPWEADGKFFTAQQEHTVEQMIPAVLAALK